MTASGMAAAPSAATAFQAGVRAHLAGDTATATRAYRHAIAADPQHSAAHNNLGTILAAGGDHAAAELHFRRATSLNDAYGEAWNNLGLVLAGTDRHAEACEAFQRATTLEPAKATWLNNLGNTLVELHRFRDAVATYDRAIAVEPETADYWANRAIALRGLRENDDAIASAQRALVIDATHIGALNNLGALLKEGRRFDEAIATFERAIALDPRDAALVANLASVHERRGDYTALRAVATRARDLDPSHPEPWNLLANAAMEAGDFDEAERLYEHVRTLDTRNRNANWNLALIWLLRGDYARGWPQFEWRKRLQSVVVDHAEYPGEEWTGGPLAGRTILLHTEQGVGDAIQFIRYAPMLKARGAARVIVEAPYPIVPLLLAARGVDQAVARGTPLPSYDVHASLMSLPAACGTTLDSIPVEVPYLGTEPRPVSAAVSAPPGVLKVGMVWAGNPMHARDHLRSAPLDAFVALARQPGVKAFSLQKGAEAERELAALVDAPVVDLAPQLNDFRDTAAAIQALDLVITVDTSVAHLAGALNIPTWVLLPHVPDFRWMRDRDDSPWYPSLRLFRQDAPGQWPGVFERLARALAERCAAGAGSATAAPASDIVTLPSATRTPDGRPRFDVWFPLSALADPTCFAEYEAELLGKDGGAHAAVRAFLHEVVDHGDVVTDTIPGLGLVATEAAVAPRAPAIVQVVAPDDAARLSHLIRSRAPTVRCITAGDIAGACAAVPAGVRHLARVGPDGARDLARAVAAGSRMPDVVVWDGAASRDAAAVRSLDGHEHFTLALERGEVSLDPLPAGGAEVAVSLAPAVLAALQGASAAATPSPTATRVIGIGWELRSDTGWGVYGINLAMELSRVPGVTPAVLAVGNVEGNPLARARLSRAGEGEESSLLQGLAAREAVRDGVLLRPLGNDIVGAPGDDHLRARRNVGVVFLEDTDLDAGAVARANAFDLIVAGSTWNEEVLRARGVSRVAMVMQGIDPSIFHPAPRAGLFPGRFVVFSGGKLEYRKGQDIVVAAFREFARTHPEALLVVAWHNAWPELLCDLDLAGHVRGAPALVGGSLAIAPWLVENGIAPTQVVDLGRQANALMGQLVREADVALFPNRAEGGTNLVAMETMAAGVPTILSANTGHLDLIRMGAGAPIEHQGRVPRPTRYFKATDGWGESPVDEVVALLERAWSDAAWRATLGRQGADAMASCTWRTQTARLLAALDPLA